MKQQLSKEQEITLFCLTDEKVTQAQLTELEKFCMNIHVYRLTRIQIIWSLFRTIFSRKPLQVGYFFNRKFHKKIRAKISRPQIKAIALKALAWWVKVLPISASLFICTTLLALFPNNKVWI